MCSRTTTTKKKNAMMVPLPRRAKNIAGVDDLFERIERLGGEDLALHHARESVRRFGLGRRTVASVINFSESSEGENHRTRLSKSLLE